MRFVYILYKPGAGGNFLAMCLDLCDDVFVFGFKDRILTNANEKFEYFKESYVQQVIHKWRDHSNKMIPLGDIISVPDLVLSSIINDNSTIVYAKHDDVQSLGGKDDTNITVIINDNSRADEIIEAKSRDGLIYRVESLQDIKMQSISINFDDFFHAETFKNTFNDVTNKLHIENSNPELVSELHTMWLSSTNKILKEWRYESSDRRVTV